MINHYKILNIPENASQEEIKVAFRKLANIYHPDKNLKTDTNQLFLNIKTAYDILSNLSSKNLYDEKLNTYKLNQQKEKFTRYQTGKDYKYSNPVRSNHHKVPKTNSIFKIIYTFIGGSIFLLIIIKSTIEYFSRTKNEEISVNIENPTDLKTKLVDSLKNEDIKIEKKLKNEHSIRPESGELKF